MIPIGGYIWGTNYLLKPNLVHDHNTTFNLIKFSDMKVTINVIHVI